MKLNKEKTLETYTEYLELKTSLKKRKLENELDRKVYDNTFQIIEMFLNDWLVTKHQTTIMDLKEAVENHREAIFHDEKINELKQ